MKLIEHTTPELCLVLDTNDKEEAFRTLSATLAGAMPEFESTVILDAVLQREQTMSTRIAPGLAMPHAQLPNAKRSLVAVLVSPSGIAYDFRIHSANQPVPMRKTNHDAAIANEIILLHE